MSKKVSNPFDKLESTETIETPVQKVVPVKEKVNKRDNEKSYTLYLHKDILRDLKQLSLDRNTNVKEIVQTAVLEYLKKQK